MAVRPQPLRTAGPADSYLGLPVNSNTRFVIE